jgi:hypothetical protein
MRNLNASMSHQRERRICDVCSRKLTLPVVYVERDGLVFILCHRRSCKRRFDLQYPTLFDPSDTRI